MEEEAVFGEVVARPPGRYVVKGVLGVAVFDVAVLDDVFKPVQVVVVGVE